MGEGRGREEETPGKIGTEGRRGLESRDPSQGEAKGVAPTLYPESADRH